MSDDEAATKEDSAGGKRRRRKKKEAKVQNLAVKNVVNVNVTIWLNQSQR